jgi:hypothetical protein
LRDEDVENHFKSAPFYRKQLFSTESSVLEVAYKQVSYCNTYGKMRSYILHNAKLDSAVHLILEDLVTYHFLGVRSSLSKHAATTRQTQHPYYYIRDAPLAMLKALKGGHNLIFSAAGLLFEEVVRDMLANSPSQDLEVKRGDWREPCTEIDVVAISKVRKTVYWGSVKLSAEQQDPRNHMAHIVSYFNNRHWQNHKYFTFSHVLLFISAEENNKARFDHTHEDLNSLLCGGRTPELEQLCKSKLSNFVERGKAFQWHTEQTWKEQIANEKNEAKGKQATKGSKKAPSTPTTPPIIEEPIIDEPIIALTSSINNNNNMAKNKNKHVNTVIDEKAFFTVRKCVALHLGDLVNVKLEDF